MASLTSIFKDVLLTNESITVPGFGTFVTAYQSAQLDEKSGTIYPPTKSVKFDATKTEDADNKLVKYMVEKQGVSEADAKKEIEEFIAQANAKFADKASLTIDEVGILEKDEAGNITLKSIPSKLSIDNYGMDTVEVEKVEEGQHIAAAAAAVASDATSKGKSTSGKATKVVSTTKTTTTTTTTETTTEKKKGNSLKWLIIILLLVAILTALFFIFKDKIFGNNGDNAASNNADTTEIQSAIASPDINESVDVESPKTEAIPETTQEGSDLDILAKAGFNSVAPNYLGSKYKKYYLVGGSYKNKANATKKKRELNAPEILKAEGSEYYRVILIGSDNAQEIIDTYQAALEKGIQPADMWLLKNSQSEF